jgi:hypothetical protein
MLTLKTAHARRESVDEFYSTMNERREKRKRWVQRGQFAVEVEVVFPADDPSEP